MCTGACELLAHALPSFSTFRQPLSLQAGVDKHTDEHQTTSQHIIQQQNK